jgi:hypothetical protein
VPSPKTGAEVAAEDFGFQVAKRDMGLEAGGTPDIRGIAFPVKYRKTRVTEQE